MGRTPMAQPPGSATRAEPCRATSGPSTRTDARIVDTSSYGATSSVTRGTRTSARRPSLATLAPCVCNSFSIVRTSLSSGMFVSVTGSAVSRDAASAGSAAFFAALTATEPCSGMPPSIRSRAGIVVVSP
jgi:hypothetical protein